MANDMTDLKKNLKTKRLVFGTKETIKNLKLGKLEKVFVTSNCPNGIKQDVTYYSAHCGAIVEQLSIPNEELGIICKKQFSISLVGLLRV